MKISSSFNFNLEQTTKKLNKTLTQLSTLKRINSASDDPAGSALAQSLTSDISGLSAANQGISMSQSALETASGAASAITDSLQRLREIAVQASNGTLNANDRANLQNEFDQVVQGIDQIAKTTSFNGQNLLDGSFSESIQTGSQSGQSTSLNLGSLTASSLGINTSGVATQSAAQDALGQIDSAISQVNNVSSQIGASYNSLDFTQNSNSVTIENLSAARSQTEDADLAELQSDLSKLKVQQAAQIAAQKAKDDGQKSYFKKLLG